jgi:Ca2+-binding EF-hand superfamily protein
MSGREKRVSGQVAAWFAVRDDGLVPPSPEKRVSEDRRAKKSESIEVRVPHAMKQRFMARCRAEGRSASDVLRGFIEQYLAEPSAQEARPMLFFAKPAALALGATAAAALLMLTPPVAATDLEAAFKSIDRNGDGHVTAEEFDSAHKDNVFLRHVAPPSEKGARPFAMPLRHPPAAMHHGAEKAPAAMLRAEFGGMDRDGNGSVSFEEFAAHHHGMMQAGFAALDANGDHAIDAAELGAITERLGHSAPAFIELDRNGDGGIDFDEFDRVHTGQ